ncbi:polyketide synthase docking domain-containing protein [Actinomadura graeca]|uniref:Polyketide synthase docking domain-containing protein n=1 Tax=Actinomadura graeca TaxID=2750812 RepID=A0ABX8R4X8_9ACTN|nr:beta-ketoacyl synthase N-terminal-like domain-containing protein [Actinomadura graeca]QXJ26140.1 polyketide synthase docking domain-containing protein [Actinomadura graeca]
MTDEQKLVDYLKWTTAELHETRRRLRESEERAREPIAIVSMACRFPGGVRSPAQLWDLVAEQRDGVTGFPSGRGWDRAWDLMSARRDGGGPGAQAPAPFARVGGFIDAAGFDAEFFGVDPAEAAAIEPLQRILLHLAWEALESGTLDPRALHGTPTGVYVGTTARDYATRPERLPAELLAHLGDGTSGGLVAGRLSATLGLEGPAMTLDTACSSALVAVHLACQALRQGECTLALAGGGTVMATPGVFASFAQQGGLAPDGRCKAFAAAADGMGLAEGVGLVLLERLSDALREGHPVLAVIRGSAVNQDGATYGLAAPNGPSQQEVIRRALASAGLSPDEVDAVEAHGTGTPLGDAIEVQALLSAYGRGRPADRPLWLGSVKSNTGHTQGASGAAGLIKMVMAMRHGLLPATLHVDRPTPLADWRSGALRLLTEPVRWTGGDGPRRAGVSSFGASGTNAHLILEEPPAPEDPVAADVPQTRGPARAVPWTVSARSPEALPAQAAALAAHVAAAGPDVPDADVAWSLAATRPVFEHRAVVVGEDRDSLLAGLRAVAAGQDRPGVFRTAPAKAAAGRDVWLFGDGTARRPGAGGALYGAFPVFAAAFDEVCALLDPALEAAALLGPDGPPDGPRLRQEVTFAVQVALARLLESLGARPDAVAGRGVGEFAAAHVAQGLDLADACRLVSGEPRPGDDTGDEVNEEAGGATGPRSARVPVVTFPVDEPSDRYLDLGPGSFGDGPDPSRTVAVLGDGRDEVAALVEALAGLHVTGTAIAWAELFGGRPLPRRVALPTYAFQERPYWLHEEWQEEAGPQGPAEEDPGDAGFWDAVEREDPAALTAVLGVPDDLREHLAAVLPALAGWRTRRKDVARRP